nr:hypothetical protein EVB34_024 [Rhizobium phage RHph_TM26]
MFLIINEHNRAVVLAGDIRKYAIPVTPNSAKRFPSRSYAEAVLSALRSTTGFAGRVIDAQDAFDLGVY